MIVESGMTFPGMIWSNFDDEFHAVGHSGVHLLTVSFQCRETT